MARGNAHKTAKVILVSNSLSTWNQKCLPDIHAVLHDYPDVVHFEGQDIKKLYKQLEAFRGASPDLLILNGGDGTIHSALTYIINKRIFRKVPIIGILGGGMTNMIAKDLNTGEKASEALAKILKCHTEKACMTQTRKRQLIRVDVDGVKKPQYGLFFGGASLINVIKFCTRRIYTLGVKGKGAQVIGVILYYLSRAVRWGRPGTLGYSPNLTIQLDNDKVLEGEFAGLVATTLNRLIFGSRAPKSEGEGFSFYTLRPSFWSMVISVIRGAKGNIHKTRNKGISYDHVKKVTIKGGYPFTLDGEIFEVPKNSKIHLSFTSPLHFVAFD